MNKKLKNEELGRISVEQFKEAKKTPITVVLDNIRSFHNVGAIFRTADSFRVEKIYLCGITATPPHREIHKTALGATESVDWEYREDTIELIHELNREGKKVVCVEQAQRSIMLNDFKPKEHLVLVFGNEVFGVQQSVIDLASNVLEIPQVGTKHSLNVSVSAGIILWDVYNKLLR